MFYHQNSRNTSSHNLLWEYAMAQRQVLYVLFYMETVILIAGDISKSYLPQSSKFSYQALPLCCEPVWQLVENVT